MGRSMEALGQGTVRRNGLRDVLARGLGRLLLLSLTGLSLAVPALLAGSAGAAGAAWTTYRHDAARSGIDPDSTSPVTPSQAWQTPPLDGQVFGQKIQNGVAWQRLN